MVTYLPLFFLQEKIRDLETALFFNLSSSVLKTSTTVVRSLTTDDCGQIWFCMPVYNRHINEYDKQFPSTLQFFKKGKNFHVRIQGRAYIVNDPEEINGIQWATSPLKVDALSGNIMLIKVQIQYADYVEQKLKLDPKNEWIGLLKSLYSTIFDRSQTKYTFLHTLAAKPDSFPGRIQYQ